jgi:hypothetical protein
MFGGNPCSACCSYYTVQAVVIVMTLRLFTGARWKIYVQGVRYGFRHADRGRITFWS